MKKVMSLRQARFPEIEVTLHKKYKVRRATGMPVDYEWLKVKMKFFVKASTKDPDGTFKASNRWVAKFMIRKGLSS